MLYTALDGKLGSVCIIKFQIQKKIYITKLSSKEHLLIPTIDVREARSILDIQEFFVRAPLTCLLCRVEKHGSSCIRHNEKATQVLVPMVRLGKAELTLHLAKAELANILSFEKFVVKLVETG